MNGVHILDNVGTNKTCTYIQTFVMQLKMSFGVVDYELSLVIIVAYDMHIRSTSGLVVE